MTKVLNILLPSLAVLFLCHQLQAASFSLLTSKQQSGVTVTVVKDIKNYTQNHPNEQVKPFNTTVVHYLGQREKGDSKLFEMGEELYYPSVNQSTFQIIYPGVNNSFVITYLEIRNVGDDGGQVYVADGGVGQRFVSCVVVPPKTDGYFSYKTLIYGRE